MAEKFASILDAICDPLTVRKFSEQCEISKDEAVTILESYVKSKGEPLWSLYEVSGTVSSSEFPCIVGDVKMYKHVVVPGSQLEDVKAKFDEVTATRLHSVQRTNPKDTRVYGRAWASNDDLQGKSVPKQEPAKKVEVVKKEKSATPEAPSKKSAPAEPVKKTIVPAKKQASVMSMFSKKPTRVEQSPSPPPEYLKQLKRPKVEVDEPEPKEPTPEPKKSKEPKKSVFEQSDDEFPSSREQTPEKEPPAKKSKVNDENKKQKASKKKLIVPDSDDEKMEETPKTPKIKREKASTPEGSERRRATRMEKVVETYVDEDGYLVSKEVQKAVECSPEKPKEKPKITALVPGTAKPGKKTATITSFFKKA